MIRGQCLNERLQGGSMNLCSLTKLTRISERKSRAHRRRRASLNDLRANEAAQMRLLCSEYGVMESKNGILIYKGKAIDELSIAELKECALHFRDAHVETTWRLSRVTRRMEKMQLGLTKEEIEKLDWWLEAHPSDTWGYNYYRDWISFVKTPAGYRTQGDRF
jgi:hypothetical protein